MCGIFAAIKLKGYFEPNEYSAFVRSTDLVSYRGPDDAGYASMTATGPARPSHPFTIFLGHRRLSILDLSAAGHQPMTDGHGLWIVFNGEIFNFLELREMLQRRGHTFRSRTDTEVILKLYAEFGEAGFAQMNGMWAMVLIDLPRRRVVVSRDRFSMKPLYITEQNGACYFASELKQISALLPSVQPNAALMSRFLDQASHCDSPETFYLGIHHVPAATNVLLDLTSGKLSSERYWIFGICGEANVPNAAEQFRELLLDSIRIRLRSDVKVGILLSGGLDSTAITTLAQQIVPNLETYSVISDGPCSEEPFIDIANRAAGCPGMKIRIRPDGVLDSIQRVIFHNDGPVGGLNVVAQFLMMQAIRRHSDSTVLLSGQGADEVLLGYLKYYFFFLRQMVRSGKFATACSESLSALIQGTVWHQFEFGKSRRYRATAGPRKFLRPASERLQLGKWDSVWQSQIADIEQFSIPALTHYEDCSSMAFGLEVRHPFLDHRLVEYSVGLPATEKIRSGWLKFLLRSAVPEMPPQIRWRRDKQGFVLPESEWLKTDLRHTIERIFQTSVLEELELLDAQSFLAFYHEFCAGARGIWHNEITRIVLAELWLRQFKEIWSPPAVQLVSA